MHVLPRLPSCRHCQLRKVKCDSGRPKCEPCVKSNTECILVDAGSGQAISRQELYELEERARQLSGNEDREDAPHAQSLTSPSPGPEDWTPSAVSQGGGLSFMSSLFIDQEWRRSNADTLKGLAKTTRGNEPSIEPNKLPPAKDARTIFDQYLLSSHIQNPPLLQTDVLDLYKRMFEKGPASQSSAESEHDLFRTFIILAIGSIHPYRQKVHQFHPLGYYVNAMKYFNPLFINNGLSPIQDLLLLTRFAVYHHIDTSIWELIRVCMRMCIEQGLHIGRENSNSSLLQEQMQRRVFWLCYMMDRYSSITLNRPFAISDDDIQVSLPANANDGELIAAQGRVPNLDAFCEQHDPSASSEMSVLIFCVKLRQISSKIHLEFAALLNSRLSHSEDPFMATGQIHLTLQKFMSELDTWKRSAPVFDTPRCLHERQEGYSLLHAREVFHLVRRAVDLAPKHDGIPSRSLLTQCQSSATRVITLYSDLFQRSLVTYTRSYFQMMFAAGLSLLYCGSALPAMTPTQAHQCGQALIQCKSTLTDMVKHLPDANQYLTVFDALHRHMSRKLKHFMQNEPAPNGQRRPERDDRFTITYNDSSIFHDAKTHNNGETLNTHIRALQHIVATDTSSAGMYAFTNEGVELDLGSIDSLDSNVWDWDLLNDDSMWNSGQYIVGELASEFDMNQGVDFSDYGSIPQT